MNKKVLKTMIFLVIGELIAWYVLKIFFPNEFIMVIQNENLTKLGTLIDSQQWSAYLLGFITSFITYALYLCAVCQQWRLKWYQYICIFIIIGISIGLSFYDAMITSAFSVVSMIFIALLFNANMRNSAIVFSVHYISQALVLSIRDLPLYIADATSLNVLMLSIDMYLWLFLFYLYYNYKKEEE